jgi:hypothetical protein
MKAGQKKESFYILGYLLELIIINLQNLANVGHFSHEKSFV